MMQNMGIRIAFHCIERPDVGQFPIPQINHPSNTLRGHYVEGSPASGGIASDKRA